jgi:hypothetical protein
MRLLVVEEGLWFLMPLSLSAGYTKLEDGLECLVGSPSTFSHDSRLEDLGKEKTPLVHEMTPLLLEESWRRR